MRNYFGGVLLMGALLTTQLSAQEAPALEGHLAVAVVYSPARSNAVGSSSFWMQGGSVQVEGRFWRGWGAVADVAVLHTGNINSSGVGLDLVTSTFGPRYTWSPRYGKLSFYGQGLAGVANGLNSVFPAASGLGTSANGLAAQVGGGIDLRLRRHLALRAIEANWLRTQLPNTTTGVQNNLRLGFGLVFRF